MRRRRIQPDPGIASSITGPTSKFLAQALTRGWAQPGGRRRRMVVAILFGPKVEQPARPWAKKVLLRLAWLRHGTTRGCRPRSEWWWQLTATSAGSCASGAGQSSLLRAGSPCPCSQRPRCPCPCCLIRFQQYFRHSRILTHRSHSYHHCSHDRVAKTAAEPARHMKTMQQQGLLH